MPVQEPGVTSTADRVDLALRHAWAALRRCGRDDRPSVAAVRVGDFGVEVLLDAPVLDAPGRFVASAGGHAWTLGAEVSDEELRASAGDEPAPLPALVSVGTTPEGPVLVDLLHAGTLSVEGDGERVAGFLPGVALELATAPWAVELAVGLVGGDGRLGALDRVELLEGTGPETPHGPVGDWLERMPAAAAVLSATPCNEVDGLAAVVGAHAGRAGLVAPGPVPGASWRLVIDAAGDAVLHPLGLELSCAVDTGAVEMTIGALSTGSVFPSPRMTEPESEGEEAAPDHHGVAVLGPVVVRWPAGAGVRPPVRRKLEEVVVYLATHHERPVPAERLRTAIWPLSDDERSGEVSDASFRATMSRARAALGAGPDGRPWLPEARERRYQLDAGFGCDWVDFAGLVRRAASAPAPEAIDLLRQALALVRGAPFADAPTGAYGWAWDEQLVSAIEVAVADAAERLARLALASGDHATARWAAAKGLLAVPTRESLYRARMRAAFEAGDSDDVEQAYTEARRAVQALDPADAPQAETTALYERLRRSTRPAPEAQAPGARSLATAR